MNTLTYHHIDAGLIKLALYGMRSTDIALDLTNH